MAFRSLAPAFLIAAPSLRDRHFGRSVILLGRHEEEGALGWVLNGSALDSVGKLLRAASLVPPGIRIPRTAAFRRTAQVGGPVHPDSGWLLYRRELASFPGELAVGEEMAVCSNPAAIQAIVQGEEPREFRLVLGYAGWGPGQLEAEIREGTWFPAEVDADLGLDTPSQQLWELALERATGLRDHAAFGKWWGVA